MICVAEGMDVPAGDVVRTTGFVASTHEVPFQDHQPPALFRWKMLEPSKYSCTTLALKPASAPLRITLPPLTVQTAPLASTICVADGIEVPAGEVAAAADDVDVVADVVVCASAPPDASTEMKPMLAKRRACLDLRWPPWARTNELLPALRMLYISLM